MKRINNKEDLPKWFKLENYLEFDELEDYRINAEIKKRVHALENVTSGISESFLNKIEAGYPISKPFNVLMPSMEEYLEARKHRAPELNENEMAEMHAEVFGSEFLTYREVFGSISPFLIDDFNNANRVLKKYFAEIHQENADLDITINRNGLPLTIAINRSSIETHAKGKITVNLDITNYSDSEILDDLKKHLKDLRSIVDMPEPTISKPRNGDYQKAKEYRIFPLFDLQHWARLSNVQIKKSVLAVCVFPEGEKGESDLNDTIKKFMDKVFSPQYRV